MEILGPDITTSLLPMVDRTVDRMGLPYDLPSGEERRHLVTLVGKSAVRLTPDACKFGDDFDRAVLRGDGLSFLRGAFIEARGSENVRGQLKPLYQIQAALMHLLSLASNYTVLKRSGQANGRGEATRTVGEKIHVVWGPNVGNLPGGEKEAAAVLAQRDLLNNTILSGSRAALLELGEDIYRVVSRLLQLLGHYEVAETRRVIGCRLEGLSQLWEISRQHPGGEGLKPVELEAMGHALKPLLEREPDLGSMGLT